MFERPHHRRIARLLASLDARLLEAHNCLLGGGTALSLLHGEFREFRDVNLLVSDRNSYRELRGIVASHGIAGLFKAPVKQLRTTRMDQYGFCTFFEVEGMPIKLAVQLEARIDLDSAPAEFDVCGVRALCPNDQITEKLLANSDRWADEGVDSRDIVDLAMMLENGHIPTAALAQATRAYSSIEADLEKAKTLIERPERLVLCMANMQMSQPPALVLDRIRKLKPARLPTSSKRP